MSTKIYIATSLDGYISDKNNSVDWLSIVPMTSQNQQNFTDFMDTIDCLVMGRNTFEVVKGFGEWIYDKKVFVASNSMTIIPDGYEDKIEIIRGAPSEIIESLRSRGFNNLYVDGGAIIQSFLREDLIDEMIISVVPVLLGGGVSLFGQLDSSKEFRLVDTVVLSDMLVQSHYVKK